MKEAFEWIKKAISTSKSEFHLEGCGLLIELFAAKYWQEGIEYREMYCQLLSDLMEKQTFLCVEV